MELPFAPSCERNQQPICEALSDLFPGPGEIVELASGTGQHGVFFAQALPHLRWQCTDLDAVLPGLGARIAQAQLPNLPAPIPLDIAKGPWPEVKASGLFAANLLHIASWPEVCSLFANCAGSLKVGGKLVIYGPFNDNGFTSEGNVALDAWAKDTFAGGGLRELSAVSELALCHDFDAPIVRTMPANNLLLSMVYSP